MALGAAALRHTSAPKKVNNIEFINTKVKGPNITGKIMRVMLTNYLWMNTR